MHADELVHRPICDGVDVPVIILIEDEEPVDAARFELLGLDDDAFDDAIEAIEDLRDGDWRVDRVAVKGAEPLTVLTRTCDDGVVIEQLLVPAVMADAAQRLGVDALAVGIPTRGTLLATAADQKWQLVAAFATAVRVQHDRGGDQRLYPGVLRVDGGKPVAEIALGTASLDAAAAKLK